jgi:ABC-type Mn2+/Zn2+ transport system permease subunit
VARSALVISLAVAVVVLAGLAAGRRALAAAALDPVAAPSLGYRPQRVALGLLAALALVLVAAVGAIGSLLALALIVAPAAAARRLTARLRSTVPVAAALAIAAGALGLWAGRLAGFEPSGTVALAAVGEFALAGGWRRVAEWGTGRPPDG